MSDDLRPGVSVVIPNWNGLEFWDELSASLKATDPCGSAELIVVDNASDDGSPSRALGLLPRANILYMTENTGFACACNAGAGRARHPYIAFVNTDTSWESDWVGACSAFLEANPRYAFAAPLLLSRSDPEVIDGAGDAVDTRFMPYRVHHGKRLGDVDVRDSDIVAASGAAVVFRADSFRLAGGFYAGFFMYYEDVDLCLRLFAMGMPGRLLCAPRVYHRDGGSMRRFESGEENRRRRLTRAFFLTRNRAYLLARHCSLGEALASGAPLVWEFFRYWAYSVRRGEGSAFVRGHLAALARAREVLGDGRRSRAGRTLSSSELRRARRTPYPESAIGKG